MKDTNIFKKTREQISLVINYLVDMIKAPNLVVNKSEYFYRHNERNLFVIYLYLFKLIINDKEYITKKYNNYNKRFINRTSYNTSNITNIETTNELQLLLIIKEKISTLEFTYNKENIYFNDNTYIDSKWLLSTLTLLLDNVRNDESKEINICYTIPSKEITKVTEKEQREKFLREFTFYNIKVKRTDTTKQVRENNILIVKNAAINYLKHLKQYKHGLEDEESYLIFYNLLKDECQKEGFELEEEEKNLLDIDLKDLAKVEEYMDEEFYTYQLSKQVHIIENIIWQSSNDQTMLEHMNTSLDSLVDFLTIIKLESRSTYETIKEKHYINDIKILLILITSKFLLTYLNDHDEIDYSILDLKAIKPKYMNSICRNQEQDLKTRLKNFNLELSFAKKKLEKAKAERASLNKEELGPDKYQKELERCVSNINRESIVIARLNSNISALSRDYEELKKEQVGKYRNIDLYNYNHSIVRHICNSILACSYYLKTSNNKMIMNNIIIFEDYEKTENSFYLEVTFKDLLKISSLYLLNGIIDQNDLPKLA